MIITSGIGNFECNTMDEYRKALIKCFNTESDYEIWCSEEIGTYPCIAILGNRNQAVINYFEEEDGNMYASLGDINQEGITEFRTKNEIYEVADYQLIPVEIAIKCTYEFFENLELPKCIKWEDL